jgi:hypothetical protein
MADTFGAHSVDDVLVRGRSLAIALEATDDGEGVQMNEPMFELVTEGRQSASEARRRRPGNTEKPYSACGDLGHYDLEHLCYEFVPDPTPTQLKEALRTLNRAELDHYTNGLNVNRLYESPAFVHHKRGVRLGARPGDIMIIGEHGNEHVLVVESIPDPGADLITIDGDLDSLDYGQVFARLGQPMQYGGKRRTRRLGRGPDGRIWATGTEGSRPVLGHVDVADWVARVRAA